MRKLMRLLGFAEYGWDELLLAILAAGVIAYLLTILVDWRLSFSVLPPLLIVFWFFRDPNRSGPGDAVTLLSPADGTITDVIEIDEPDFLNAKALRIGIFLSPLNVHVNRTSCAGVVRFLKFKQGECLPAYNPKAPERNESMSLGLETPEGRKIMLKQITGILARRIVCEAKIGDPLACGQRYGMIKFGSRTELYVPLSDKPIAAVKVGDKVRGGETVICKLNME
ncbi:MAG TPA: phosphatidylserine decarboxylase [Planctomycetota bacterium]|nr:phosphatidylserine decarboxylase [Planctomycetota bacterium]